MRFLVRCPRSNCIGTLNKLHKPLVRERILVLLDGEQNRRLLTTVLSDRYEVYSDLNHEHSRMPEGPFDLCMLDGVSLNRHQVWLSSIRHNLDPLYFPVLLLADKSETSHLARGLWQIVDDVLLRPVDRLELVTRVQSLLRTRAMSLRAHRMFGLYEQEARIARRLQAAAVPNAFPQLPNVYFNGFYQPADVDAKIGGDWYDVLRLIDGRVVISVGDVAGSGLDAAVTMGKLRQVVRAVAQLKVDPAFILHATEQALQTDEPDRFVTAFIGILDMVGQRFDYSSAGHPMPILRRPDGTLETMAPADLLLGTGMRIQRVNHSLHCPPGSSFVFYTDGLTEATRDVIEGQERLENAVLNMRFATSGDIAQDIYANVVQNEANDDTAILVIVLAPESPHPALSTFTFRSSDIERVRAVQRAIVEKLSARKYDADTLAACELAFMELVGNAVRYAPGEVNVVLDTSNPAAILHVLDRGPGFTYVRPEAVEQTRESGRGLFIIAALTEKFFVSHRLGGGSHARVVLPMRSQ